MSASSQIPDQAQPKAARRTRREQTRTVALLILAVLITVFAFLNLKQVKVDWIVGSGRAPLIIVIVVSLIIGVVLGHFAERRASKRR